MLAEPKPVNEPKGLAEALPLLLDAAVLLLFDWPKENPVEAVEAGGGTAPGADPKLNDGADEGVAEPPRPFRLGRPRILVVIKLHCQHDSKSIPL